MSNLNDKQIEKLFYLAGLEMPPLVKENDISMALVEIEKKISPSAVVKNQLNHSGAPSVLIIDDLELSIHQLSLLLTKSGYDIHIARSYDEAIQQYKKQKFHFVLLDLFMPEPEDGIRLLGTIKGMEKTANDDTTIIIISGTDSKDLINTCFTTGANEFIGKSPEWHRNILKYIKTVEAQRKGAFLDIYSKVEDQGRKIASISVNVSNLNNPNIIEDLQKEFVSLVNSGTCNIILDLKNVDSISAKAVNAIVAGYKLCSEHSGVLKLCGVKAPVEETLSYFFLPSIIYIYPEKSIALGSF